MSENNFKLCPSFLPSINKKNVEEDNRNDSSPCQQCVTCGRFGIANSTMEMLPINLVNKEQNNEYICTNKSFYTTHLEKIRIHGKNKSRGIEMVRSL